MLGRQALAAVLLIGLGSGLAGCQGVTEQFGLTKTPPDEFVVYARAPLSVPPDFALLPPEPGAPRPQEATPRQQAETALYSNSGTFTAGGELVGGGTEFNPQSVGEQAFLQSAGADGIDPSIRSLVDTENATLAEQSTTFTDTLVFWRDPVPYGTIVDPAAEQQRIQENAALGVPVTTGETPIIERKEKGILEDVF
ncbi:MAG: DUF3035 domain-containing protein [Dongiaceae bacterium]